MVLSVFAPLSDKYLGVTGRRWSLTALLALLCLALPSKPAYARSAGIAALGCEGCHQGGRVPTVTLTSDPLSPAVGEAVTLTISVSQANGSSAGFYLTTTNPAPGAFQSFESGTVATATEVMHSTPRAGSGGTTIFKAKWTASEATGVKFDAFAVSANQDRTNRGDGAGAAQLELVIGCSGTTYYIDQDGDGYGSTDPAYPPRKDCSLPPGYATLPGDCDDFHSQVHPGAAEQCDLKDNDCDGNADEDVVDQPYCEDHDGDGHGVASGAMKMDCKPSAGFGDCAGDCDDGDDHVYPGAAEACDGRDEDCDGKVDEGVRVVCGLGLCSRYAASCTSTCTPGQPFAETCNGYDDDCDGVVDNGSSESLCGDANASCAQGRCLGGSSSPGGSGGLAGSGASGGAPQSGASGLAASRSEASCSFAYPGGSALASAAVLAAALAFSRRSARRSRKAARASNTLSG